MVPEVTVAASGIDVGESRDPRSSRRRQLQVQAVSGAGSSRVGDSGKKRSRRGHEQAVAGAGKTVDGSSSCKGRCGRTRNQEPCTTTLCELALTCEFNWQIESGFDRGSGSLRDEHDQVT